MLDIMAGMQTQDLVGVYASAKHVDSSPPAKSIKAIADLAYVITICLKTARNTLLPRKMLEDALASIIKTKRWKRMITYRSMDRRLDGFRDAGYLWAGYFWADSLWADYFWANPFIAGYFWVDSFCADYFRAGYFWAAPFCADYFWADVLFLLVHNFVLIKS